MKGLTQKQKQILHFIHDFIGRNRYSPSYKEIMAHFSFASTGSVHRHIQTLKRKGVVTSERGCSRSIKPSEKSLPEPSTTDIALPFIGTVSSNKAIEMFIRPQVFVVPKALVPDPEHTYVIRVQGSTWNEEMIADGDLLLVEAGQEIRDGELIIVSIDHHDIMIKHFYTESQFIRLEGNTHRPLILEASRLTVHGIVVGLIRAC